MALTVLSIPLGVVLFVILVVAVAAWWVAAVAGLYGQAVPASVASSRARGDDACITVTAV